MNLSTEDFGFPEYLYAWFPNHQGKRIVQVIGILLSRYLGNKTLTNMTINELAQVDETPRRFTQMRNKIAPPINPLPPANLNKYPCLPMSDSLSTHLLLALPVPFMLIPKHRRAVSFVFPVALSTRSQYSGSSSAALLTNFPTTQHVLRGPNRRI